MPVPPPVCVAPKHEYASAFNSVHATTKLPAPFIARAGSPRFCAPPATVIWAPGVMASSFVIVPMPFAFEMVALQTGSKCTENVSSGSAIVSPLTSTWIGRIFGPLDVNVRWPGVGT